jgi:hypothetical protein
MKHTVKRVPIGNGDFYEDRYEYRGCTIYRHDNVPNGYGGRWSVGKYDSDSRRDCIAWVDRRIAEREAK